MKLLIILGLFITSVAHAQSWQEWTQQKKTQIKYLLQQIATNKIYIDYLQKGYTIANKGITTICHIKDGDFNLHQDFFSSLKTVNLKIRKYAKVADIIVYQVRIIKEAKRTLQGIREMGQFTANEMDHCKMVFNNLLEDCLKSVDELFLLITPGELTMKDDERLKRIDALYTDMQGKWSFCASFSNEMGLLSVQRMSEQMEIKRSELLNGLK